MENWFKKDIRIRLYQLGLSIKEVDSFFDAKKSSKSETARALSDYNLDPDAIQRDLSPEGRQKAEFIMKSLMLVDMCRQYVTVEAPASVTRSMFSATMAEPKTQPQPGRLTSAEEKKRRRRYAQKIGNYTYHGNGHDVIPPEKG